MKKIICSLSVMVVLGLGAADSFAQKGKPLFPQAPGMEAYTYRESFKKDVAATLDTIKALGITELESGPNPNGLTPEAFRKMLDERGLTCPSIGAGYDDIVKDPAEVVRKAKVLGAKYVMVAWIPHKKEFTLEDAQKAAADFNRVEKCCRKMVLPSVTITTATNFNLIKMVRYSTTWPKIPTLNTFRSKWICCGPSTAVRTRLNC
jgi:hypothetical protein